MNIIIQPKRSLAEIIAEKKLAAQQKKIVAEGDNRVSEKLNRHVEAAKDGTSSFVAALVETTPMLQVVAQVKQRTLKEILEAAKQAKQQTDSTGTQASPKVEEAAAGPDTLDSTEQPSIIPASVEEVAENLLPLIALQPEAPSETFSLSIVLNKEQQLAKELAFTGKSFVLAGPAGTGKTTAQREIASELLRQNQLGTHSFRIQGSGEHVSAPSIAFVAYTRIASGNLRRAIHKDPQLEEVFQHNITTVHNLLEYTPETYWNYETNQEAFRFIPRRNAQNPLDITHLIIEEATMIGVADLWPKLYEALRPDVQIIFIGDINQLQPVFGASVFNYALTQLPVVELTKVYRQKEGSSILDNAHKILRGEFPLIEDQNFKIIRGGTVQHTQPKLAQSLGATIPKWAEAGEYDPDQDIILSPWNKHDLGTDNLNKIVAQYLGDKRDAVVWEIICGIAKLYLAVGDKVLFNKQVGIITKIGRNYDYTGKQAKPESKNLLRFGAYRGSIDSDDSFELEGYENLDIDRMMDEEVPEKKRQASHFVELEMETGITERLSAVGDFSPQCFSLGYALTVHKAQGCEWRKVFIVLHKDHSISAHRELFYTAVTRSREQCVIIAKDFMIEKAIKAQKIKGNTVAEKIAYFNSGITLDANIRCTK